MCVKDREAAGAICLMKVQGNTGGEIDRGVRKDLVNFRTFHMEYDICSINDHLVLLLTLSLIQIDGLLRIYALRIYVWFWKGVWYAH